jgi:Tfp pilus assembly protein PilV
MKATAAVETTTATTVETTTATTVESTTATTVETAAPAAAMTRLGYVCEREPCQCAHHDPSHR